MHKPLAFISHISEERELAEMFKAQISHDFLGMVEVFVSSDHRSISVGSRWLDEIDEALRQAQVELVLCSTDSVRRPWVNFEAGAAWVKKIPVIPVCHTGMRPVDLPIPLNMLQGIEAHDPAGLGRIYQVLSGQLGSSTPSPDFSPFVARIRDFEHRYGLVREVRIAVHALIALIPDLKQIFAPGATTKEARGDVLEHILNQMVPHLKTLQDRGMLSFGIAGNKIVFAKGGAGGNVVEINIRILPPYDGIAGDVVRS